MGDGAGDIERLRRYRVRPERDLSLAGVMGRTERHLRRQQRALSGVAEAWMKLAPAELSEKAVLVGLRRGVLTVRIADAPARFQLDRWLRAGGERELVAASPVTVRRIKVVS